MKIGVLTYHYSKNNYGAVLQTFASVFLLKKLGLDPTVLDLRPKEDRLGKRNVKSIILKAIRGEKKFDKFRKNYMKFTTPLWTYEDCEEQNSFFDTFYAGSDQIWRPVMAKDRLYRYFFDFVDDDKDKISYAASFGTHIWEGTEKDTAKISNLLKRFKAVSVREDSGVKICENEFNVNAIHVLDPTLLLNQEDYNKIIKDTGKKIKNQPKYIGLYLLDDIKGEGMIPKKVQEQKGLATKNIYSETLKIFNYNFFRYNEVGEWLQGIKNAEIVITDSYHCVIFSIIFQKEFICIINERKGVSRIESLLNMLGLENRMYSKNDLSVDLNNPPIEYSRVSKKLDQQKEASLSYLKTALNLKL